MKQPGKFLTAEWRSLAMLNYQVDAAILKPHVPAGTELDSFDGAFYISMVGFLFQRTRVLGAPIPGYQDFEEVNLRFYVRRHQDGWKRGVVFLKEIVPKFAIAVLARELYNENYVTMPMRHRADSNRVEYGWRYSGNWNHMGVEIAGEPALGSGNRRRAWLGGGGLARRIHHRALLGVYPAARRRQSRISRGARPLAAVANQPGATPLRRGQIVRSGIRRGAQRRAAIGLPGGRLRGCCLPWC